MNYQQLEKLLDDDLNWRKQELTDLLFLAKKSDKTVVLKSLILLLYAHWEGYIKKSGKIYVKYVVEKKIPIKDLTYNFKAAAIKGNISKCIDQNNALTLSNELEFISKYLKLEKKKFKINIDPDKDTDKSVIDTSSNLNPKVFKNICSVLGITYNEAIEIRKQYIDRSLLYTRNIIGHGSKYEEEHSDELQLDLSDVEKLKNIIVLIIDNFRDLLLDYAYDEFYLIENDEKKAEYDRLNEIKLEKELKVYEDLA